MRVLPLVLNACCAAVVLTGTGVADTYTYSYSGRNYQSTTGPYTYSEHVMGEVTLAAPLAANMVLPLDSPSLAVLSFSFSDGVQTITNASTDLTTVEFAFGTNAAGVPTQWSVDLDETVSIGFIFNTPNIVFNEIRTVDQTNLDEDYASYENNPRGGYGGFGVNQSAPGSWTLTVNATPAAPVAATPEPATLLLAVSGVAGLAGRVRRRAG